MRRILGFLAFSTFMTFSIQADANFIITLPTNVNILAGNSSPTTIVASISGTSSDVIDEMDLVFRITKDPSNAIAPPAYPQFLTPMTVTDPTFNDPLYIFNNGNSLFAGSGPFGTASNPGTGYNTKFTGGDLSLSDVNITSANDHLADLLINSTASGVTNAGGDLYDITVDLANSQFYYGNHVLINPSTITVNSGTIRIVAPSGVPEPNSLVLALIGSAFVSGLKFRRKRK
jgi:hypothetical protein